MWTLFVVLLCASGLALNVIKGNKPIYDLEKIDEYFEAFLLKYDKKYSDEIEKQMRIEIFRKNVEKINTRNMDPNELAILDITKFSDLTEEEFKRMYTGLILVDDENILKSRFNVSGVKSPDSFDWRDRNVVTEIKNQGNCGSCWAFSGIGAVESQYAIKTGQLVSLSEQQLLDCVSERCSCNGGTYVDAMGYLKGSGAEREDAYPYTERKNQCRYDQNQVVVRVTDFRVYDLSQETEDALKDQLYSSGPLSIALDANGLNQYSGGIWNTCGNRPDHAVLLVGYGNENGQPYWIIKNSWGTAFGEAGYFRLLRGSNACGLMQTSAVAPQVA